MKELKIGEDYSEIFGYDPDKGFHLYYQGGDNWRVVSSKVDTIKSSADTTAKALEYINRPSVFMGRVG